jgi:hypothetical protein
LRRDKNRPDNNNTEKKIKKNADDFLKKLSKKQNKLKIIGDIKPDTPLSNTNNLNSLFENRPNFNLDVANIIEHEDLNKFFNDTIKEYDNLISIEKNKLNSEILSNEAKTEAQQIINMYQNKINELNSHRNKYDTSILNYKNRNKTIVREKEEMEKKYNDIINIVRELENKKELNENDKIEYERQIEKLDNNMNILKEENHNLNEMMKNIKEEMNLEAINIHELKKNYENEINHLKNKIEELTESINEIENEREALDEQYQEELKVIKNQYETKLNEIEETYDKKNKKYKNKINQLQEDYENKFNSLKEEYEIEKAELKKIYEEDIEELKKLNKLLAKSNDEDKQDDNKKDSSDDDNNNNDNNNDDNNNNNGNNDKNFKKDDKDDKSKKSIKKSTKKTTENTKKMKDKQNSSSDDDFYDMPEIDTNSFKKKVEFDIKDIDDKLNKLNSLNDKDNNKPKILKRGLSVDNIKDKSLDEEINNKMFKKRNNRFKLDVNNKNIHKSDGSSSDDSFKSIVSNNKSKSKSILRNRSKTVYKSYSPDYKKLDKLKNILSSTKDKADSIVKGVGNITLGVGKGAKKLAGGVGSLAVGAGKGAGNLIKGVGSASVGLGKLGIEIGKSGGEMLVNQMKNTGEVLKEAGLVAGNTTANAANKLIPAFINTGKGAINLADQSGKLTANLTTKYVLPATGKLLNTGVNTSAILLNTVGTGLSGLGKGIGYINELINDKQLEIYKGPNVNATYNDIINSLKHFDTNSYKRLYNLTLNYINNKYDNENTRIRYINELEFHFEKTIDNPTDKNIIDLAEFLYKIKNVDDNSFMSKIYNKLFDLSNNSKDYIKKIGSDIKFVKNKMSQITEKISKTNDRKTVLQLKNELKEMTNVDVLLNDYFDIKYNLLENTSNNNPLALTYEYNDNKPQRRYPKRDKSTNYVNPDYDESKFNSYKPNYLNTLEFLHSKDYKKNLKSVRDKQKELIEIYKSNKYVNNDIKQQIRDEFKSLKNIIDYFKDDNIKKPNNDNNQKVYNLVKEVEENNKVINNFESSKFNKPNLNEDQQIKMKADQIIRPGTKARSKSKNKPTNMMSQNQNQNQYSKYVNLTKNYNEKLYNDLNNYTLDQLNIVIRNFRFKNPNIKLPPYSNLRKAELIQYIQRNNLT